MERPISRTRHYAVWLASEPFFWIIVAVCVLQATWIALSGRYPMAFDEDFHLGIIRLYAHHISPFWSKQPAGADAYGAVARDPSYLYQYLMSFPYRLISLFTSDQTIQVLILRFINIGLLTSSLGLFRRLLQKTGASRALVHSCLAVFVLIPVVSLLAAQINYDNLMIPLTALTLLMALGLSERFKRHEALDIQACLVLLSACLLTSLVKYSFLPIFLAIIIFILMRLWHMQGDLKGVWHSMVEGLQQIPRRSLLIFGGLVVLSSGLFIQRYGVNVVRYHELVPDCSQVLSLKQCNNYGPFARNYNDETLKQQAALGKPSTIGYSGDWFYGMWLRTFFAVDGPHTNFETREPLLIPGVAAVVLVLAGIIAFCVAGRRILQDYHAPPILLFSLASALYICALWLDDYKGYIDTAQPVAINGRYLFPVLPLVLLLMGLAYSVLLKHWLRARVLLVSITLLSLLWGGGALTYILRSNNDWYWPSRPIQSVNRSIQNALGPLTPGYTSPTKFSL